MSVYLRNAAGLFVQLFPCMAMVLLPFPGEAYRFRKGRVFAGIAILALALAALFPAAMRAASDWSTALAANLYMLAAVALALAAECWLVREALIKKALAALTVLFYGASQYWLVNVLNGILPARIPLSRGLEAWAVYSPRGLALYAVTAALLLPLMALFVIRPLREYLQEVETRQMRRECTILLLSTVAFLALMVSTDLTYYYLDYRLYLNGLVLFLIVMADQLAIYWLVFRESVRRKRDGEHQRAMEIQRLQYEKIIGDMENTRRMRHDLRHHYTVLSEMLQGGRLPEMKDYLAQVLDVTTRRMNETYCRNLLVNGLLQYYAGLARDADIRCDIQAACDEVSIEASDLTVLFGNAMENAINACRRCPENRWIRLRAGTLRDSLAIEISNSCRGVRLARRIQTEDGFLPAEAFLSNRAGGGYGLQSIAQTARKYGGSARFRYNAEREMFTARIRLNMPTDA